MEKYKERKIWKKYIQRKNIFKGNIKMDINKKQDIVAKQYMKYKYSVENYIWRGNRACTETSTSNYLVKYCYSLLEREVTPFWMANKEEISTDIMIPNRFFLFLQHCYILSIWSQNNTCKSEKSVYLL